MYIKDSSLGTVSRFRYLACAQRRGFKTAAMKCAAVLDFEGVAACRVQVPLLQAGLAR